MIFAEKTFVDCALVHTLKQLKPWIQCSAHALATNIWLSTIPYIMCAVYVTSFRCYSLSYAHIKAGTITTTKLLPPFPPFPPPPSFPQGPRCQLKWRL